MQTVLLMLILAFCSSVFISHVFAASINTGTCQPDSEAVKNAPVKYGDETLWYKCGFPNPLKDAARCGLSEPGMVCNPDGVLTAQEASGLDEELEKFRKNSICICGDCVNEFGGIPLWIVVVNHLAYTDLSGNTCIHGSCDEKYPKVNMTVRQPLPEEVTSSSSDFAEYLAEAWQYRASCNIDVILLYVASQKEVYIAAQNVKKAYITEGEKPKIYGSGREFFQKGQVTKGLRAMITNINKEYVTTVDTKQIVGLTLAGLLGAAIVFGFLVGFIYCYRLGKQSGNGCCYGCKKWWQTKEGLFSYWGCPITG